MKVSASFNRYAIWLGVITLLLYLGFGGVSFLEYQQARQQLQDSDLAQARAELESTLDKVMRDLRAGLRGLSNWDELYQQLGQPVYYVYWYANRIRGGDVLDERFVDLALYDTKGAALSVFELSDMPTQIDPGDIKEIYQVADGDVSMVLIMPLKHSELGPVEGYIGVQAKLGDSLRRLQAFNQIDIGSLHFVSDVPVHDEQDLLAAARYSLRPSEQFAIVDELVAEVIATLGLLVLLPNLILVMIFIRFVGLAVRRVPAVVARLRNIDQPDPQETGDDFWAADRDGLRILELETAEKSLIGYHNELMSAHQRLDQSNQELWTMAHQDVLTGVQNRRAFDDYWATLRDIAGRREQTQRLVLIDINHFKAINDSYGHQVGDAVLTGVATCLQQALRKHEALFRLGGDEFAAVLIDCPDEQARAVAQRCEDEVRKYPFATKLGITESVRLSIGISAEGDDPKLPVKELLHQADMAMYASKRPGTQAITIYDPRMDSDTGGIFSSSANEALYRAIERGEGMEIHYQPIAEIHSGRVKYYEALLRLRHGGRLIGPGEFFPIVESRHLDMDLDRAVIRAVLEDLKQGLIPDGTGVSINLSANSVVDDLIMEWLRPLREFTASYKVAVELTETTLITQMEKATANLNQMRELGLLVALDDFGSGYSSLRYLTKMPVDIVKFDISLVHALGVPAQRRLIRHLIELIDEAGQERVAEGIENETLLEQAKDVGFDSVQGWLLGRPEPLQAPKLTNVRNIKDGKVVG